jgi:hypothetical protein
LQGREKCASVAERCHENGTLAAALQGQCFIGPALFGGRRRESELQFSAAVAELVLDSKLDLLLVSKRLAV